MGWRSLIDAGWKPPYLACISQGGSHAGSGLLLGPRHVLTALHVIAGYSGDSHGRSAADNRFATLGEPLPEPSAEEPIDISFATAAPRTFVGRCRAFDRINDIALLELDGALHGVAAPRFAEGPPRERQAVAALGFIAQGKGRPPEFKLQTGEVSSATALRDAGRDQHYQVNYGAQGGFSGGPVFVADEGPCPRLIGMSRLGGDAFGHGKIVAADLILDWLRPRLPDFSTRPATPEGRGEILARGFEPYYRIASGQDFVFAAIEGADRTTTRQTFVALAPLSRAAVIDGGVTTAFDGERPAHFASTSDIERALERLGHIHGARFRIPTVVELTRLGALGRCTSSRGLLGEPSTMRRFVGDDGGPRPAPDGVLEWCATSSGLAVREHRGGGLRDMRPVARPQTRIVARLAFDMEFGS